MLPLDGVYVFDFCIHHPNAFVIIILIIFLLRFELSYNNDDDDDDETDGNTVSSSVSGSDRVRWWKQLIWFDFVIWLDDGHIIVFVLLLWIFVIDKCEEDDEWFAILLLVNWIVDFILKFCEWFDWMSFSDGVSDAVVVMGNDNALWCDTVNAFDATTEKQLAATTAINEKKKRKTKKRKKNV